MTKINEKDEKRIFVFTDIKKAFYRTDMCQIDKEVKKLGDKYEDL